MADFNRWNKFWARLGLIGNGQSEYVEFIVKNYSHKDRHYHNLTHIQSCLEDFEQVMNLPEHPKAVESGIWFHDSIYDPKRTDNEEKSAGIAYGFLIIQGLPREFADRVYDLILASKHRDPPKNLDEKIITDIDLAILGKPELEFDLYEANIRNEYIHVPEDIFKEKRSELLKMFLSRPSIYSADFFKNKYEEQARINLERSLKNLT